MSRKLRLFLSALLLIVFTASTTMLARYLDHRQQSEDSQTQALNIAMQATSPEDPAATILPESLLSAESTEPPAPPPEPVWVPAPFQADPEHMAVLKNIDLNALRQVNPDVIGWIYIPGTGIHFPLLQGEDNSFYLDHSWDGRSNVLGSIYLESKNNPDFSDFNTIIYGHNITGGKMFGPLHRYTNEDYRRLFPYVYILTDQGIFRYEIFATFLADLDSPVYGLSFNQTATREKFLSFALENAQTENDIVPNLTDRILTLSTCTGRGHDQRRVVLARMEMEKVTAETSAVTQIS